MNRFDELRLGIYELALESENELLDGDEYFEEKVINSFKKKIKEIKNKKPKSYDDKDEIKKFVDENYDELIRASEYLEKEPEKLRKIDIRDMIGIIIHILSILGAPVLFVTMVETNIPLSVSGFILWFITFIGVMIDRVIKYMKINKDLEIADDLSKIRSSLVSVEKSKLDTKCKNKISDIISSIDDAETSVRKIVKVTKESVNDIKLEIYEKAYQGEITDKEKEILLETLATI